MRQRQENRLPFWCETKILAGCRQSNKKGTDGLWFNPCVPFYYGRAGSGKKFLQSGLMNVRIWTPPFTVN